MQLLSIGVGTVLTQLLAPSRPSTHAPPGHSADVAHVSAGCPLADEPLDEVPEVDTPVDEPLVVVVPDAELPLAAPLWVEPEPDPPADDPVACEPVDVEPVLTAAAARRAGAAAARRAGAAAARRAGAAKRARLATAGSGDTRCSDSQQGCPPYPRSPKNSHRSERI
jgi:hypothetical protein